MLLKCSLQSRFWTPSAATLINGLVPPVHSHYKYPPAEIPAKLIQAGADIEARDSKGLTALQISLLSGW